jgi:glucose/arabinose dehydrogenase
MPWSTSLSRPRGRPARRGAFVALAGLGLLLGSVVAPVQARGPAPQGEAHRFLHEQKSTTPPIAASTPIVGFTDTAVISTGTSSPTAVRFASDGRVLVALKEGRVLVFPTLTSASTVALDLRTAVHNFWDRGLLGFALDPAFATNGNVYVLYAYDHVLGSGGTAPRWGDTCPTPPGATTDGCVVSARLSRLTLTNNVAGPEQVLIEDWCQQFPSHSVGTLAFGADGYLYASAGDGASFNAADWGQFGGGVGSPTTVNPCGDPPGGAGVANTSPSGRGGALRSQSLRRPAGEPVSLDGAIIRINPATGAAAADNPGVANPNANAARIVAHGLRNPFRFTFRPGTNELWIGDVGWNTWEEINRLAIPAAAPIENFGWPCYEGAGQQSGYSALTMCQNLYAAGASAVEPPVYTYNHGSSVVTGDNCPTANGSAITGVTFYQGGTYPSKYTNALFFADHSRNCIWAMLPTNGIPDPAKRELLVGAASNPVDLQIGPGGDLFYVDLEGFAVHRLTYNGANTPPVASFSATPSNGVAPLDVAFDARASSDPDAGDTIRFAWDFTNDGTTDATTSTAAFRYSTPGVYTARLTVTDSRGSSSSTTQTITANNTAPVAVINSPTSALQWAVGDSIAFGGSASDTQDGSVPASGLTWTFTLFHCTTPSTCHSHLLETRSGVASGTFSAPDHDFPSYLEIGLKATDSGGLSSTTTTVRVDPKTVSLSFATAPNGLALVIDGVSSTAPIGSSTIARTVIVNSQNTVTAPSPQVLNGTQYGFVSWSDGATAQSRTLTAPASAGATLTANFVASADLSVSQAGVLAADKNSISWTITVRNAAGGNAASSASITDTLSSNVATPGVFTADPGWTCGAAGGTVTCTTPSIASGASSQVRFTTPVVARKANKADNTVRVSSSTPDVATANNVSTVTVRIR